MFGYVKKKEYDELYSYYKAALNNIKGYQRFLEEQEKRTELSTNDPNIGKLKRCTLIQNLMLKVI